MKGSLKQLYVTDSYHFLPEYREEVDVFFQGVENLKSRFTGEVLRILPLVRWAA